MPPSPPETSISKTVNYRFAHRTLPRFPAKRALLCVTLQKQLFPVELGEIVENIGVFAGFLGAKKADSGSCGRKVVEVQVLSPAFSAETAHFCCHTRPTGKVVSVSPGQRLGLQVRIRRPDPQGAVQARCIVRLYLFVTVAWGNAGNRPRNRMQKPQFGGGIVPNG